MEKIQIAGHNKQRTEQSGVWDEKEEKEKKKKKISIVFCT